MVASRISTPRASSLASSTPSGGTFAVAPVTTYDAEQRYLDRTNVLQTTFTTAGGEVTLTDFMPVYGEPDADSPSTPSTGR